MINFLAKVCFYAISTLWVAGLVVQRLWLPFLTAIAIITGVAVLASGNALTSLGIAVAGCLLVTIAITFSELSKLN